MALRVLIVDDAAFVRDTIKRTLRKFLPKVEIHDAVNGHRAIAVLKANKIDVILSDWEMPEMSGEELLAWVREQEKYEKAPFIMITSRGDKEHVVKAVQSGVSDYMTKPFTPDELQRKVMKQLKRIGYKAPKTESNPLTSTESSLDVLTGGANKQVQTPQKKAPQKQKPREVKDAAAVFAKPAAPAPQKKSAAAGHKGQAQIRFPNATCKCVIKDLSLQAMNGVMERPDQIPAVFDQAVVDMEDPNGEGIARLNAYVHSITAFDPRPNSERLKIIVRFVDNDPDKFEHLSKVVTR